MLTERTFDPGEVTINYAEGPEAGPPLILLHGSTLRWQNLDPLIPPLSQSWHVYACDLRGHGKSGRATSGYRIIDYLSDTTAFVQQHIGKPTILLGHSMGAMVALGVASRVPKLVRAIILLDPPLLFRHSSIKAIHLYDWFTGLDAILKSAQSIEEVMPKFIPDIDEAGLQIMSEMINSLDPEIIAVHLNDQLFDGLDLEQLSQQVVCPTLFLYGNRDLGGIVSQDDADFFKANVPQSIVIQIKDAGHMLHLDQADQVLENISLFANTL